MEFNATFIITTISFILFTFIMNKIFYAPLGKIIDERQKYIDGAYNDAKNSKDKAASLLKNRDDSLSKTAEDAKHLINSSIENANSNSNNFLANAKQSSIQKINVAKAQLELENRQNEEELKSKINDLAKLMASKVLNTNVEIDASNNELIDRILS